ncbi:hypothetical protein [Pseudolactococcus raffinolactis]|uniref:hypothetical protein n=1 Tax=Pseudolactococcus raffinolactis TaxID=1366 RepID=UPI0014367D9F|nr:hypothetical protein [Lactococcus raffinolactis]QIW50621.1 hypothetical protein GU337_01395 [Lactococcus raffinolactis]
MKKQIAILLSATALLTGLSACSSKPSTDSSTDKKTETVKKSSKSEEKKASSEVKKSSKQSSSEKTDNFDLMIEAAQSQTATLKQQFGDMFSDITITKGEGHTIVYTYTYTKDPGIDIDAAALKPTLVKGLKPTMDSVKAIVHDAKIQVIYQRPDHSELANITITQEDTDSIS